MSLEILTKSIEDHGKAVDEAMQGIKQIDGRLFHLEQLAAGGDGLQNLGQLGQPTETAIKQFIKSAGLESMKSGARDTGRVLLKDVSIKALVNDGRGQTGDNGVPVPPQRAAGIFNDPRLPLTLLSVLPSIPVASDTYQFTQLNSYTNGAGYQLKEGDTKAESDLSLVEAEAKIATIAHWMQASQQILADSPSLENFINNLLTYGVMAKLENELINGTAGSGKITGLKAQATPFVPNSAETPVDRIGSAIAQMKASGWNPSVVLMNPLDWFDISKTKTGNQEYLLGSPQSPAAQNLWGCTIVTSPSIARGSVLVMDPAQVAVLDRMTPTVIASRFDRDNLITNMVTILAEMRAGLAVFAKSALYSVALTSA